MILAPTSCHACGKIGAKLLRCGRCRNAWFCNRECQIVARKELGHRGANCCPAAGVQQSPPSSVAPSQPPTPMDEATLIRIYSVLTGQAHEAQMANTRIGLLAAAERNREAAAVADLIGGANGAGGRADADKLLAVCMFNLGNMAAAARAACSSLRAARASGSRTMLVTVLVQCGVVAQEAPDEMAKAERESREQERLRGSPLHGGLDLSQEARVSLPTTPAAVARLCISYHEAAVALCASAVAAAGGRGSLAAADNRRVPALRAEAHARSCLGVCLRHLDEEQQRSLDLLRQAEALSRQVLRAAAPGRATLDARADLADQLCTLGDVLAAPGSNGMAEGEACLREALALGEGLGDVFLTGRTRRHLINLCCEAHAAVGSADAEALRSRLNQLLVQMGRSPETSCSICLEPLAPPADGAAEVAAGGGGSGGAGGSADSCVCVMNCNHQFHYGCLLTWRRTTSNHACPLCKKKQ